jgi:UDP-glucose 4-epimerase
VQTRLKVLVTGSAGRIGRAVYGRLLKQHTVVGLDIVASPTTDVVGSVEDAGLLQGILRDCHSVVHTAALHAPHVGHASSERFWAVNVEATERLARLSAKAGARRFVFTSTTALYGAGRKASGAALWLDEASIPEPVTVYHGTKVAAEMALHRIASTHDLQVTVLRIGRCFPEPASLMAVYRLHRGVDVRDVAAAHELALASDRNGYRHYVISGSTPFRFEDSEELIEAAPAVLQRRCPSLVAAFHARGWPLPATIDRVYWSNSAGLELGWVPRFGWDEVLAELDRPSPEVLPPLPLSPGEGRSLRFALGLCGAEPN